jgi:hypothetical protein
MHEAYFEVTYRGLTVEVEPVIDTGQWECRLDTGADWCPLGIGCWPAVSANVAKAKAVEFIKSKHPEELSKAYLELTRINERIAKLRSGAEPVVFNPVLHSDNVKG